MLFECLSIRVTRLSRQFTTATYPVWYTQLLNWIEDLESLQISSIMVNGKRKIQYWF